jgi:hypothetical protein
VSGRRRWSDGPRVRGSEPPPWLGRRGRRRRGEWGRIRLRPGLADDSPRTYTWSDRAAPAAGAAAAAAVPRAGDGGANGACRYGAASGGRGSGVLLHGCAEPGGRARADDRLHLAVPEPAGCDHAPELRLLAAGDVGDPEPRDAGVRALAVRGARRGGGRLHRAGAACAGDSAEVQPVGVRGAGVGGGGGGAADLLRLLAAERVADLLRAVRGGRAAADDPGAGAPPGVSPRRGAGGAGTDDPPGRPAAGPDTSHRRGPRVGQAGAAAGVRCGRAGPLRSDPLTAPRRQLELLRLPASSGAWEVDPVHQLRRSLCVRARADGEGFLPPTPGGDVPAESGDGASLPHPPRALPVARAAPLCGVGPLGRAPGRRSGPAQPAASPSGSARLPAGALPLLFAGRDVPGPVWRLRAERARDRAVPGGLRPRGDPAPRGITRGAGGAGGGTRRGVRRLRVPGRREGDPQARRHRAPDGPDAAVPGGEEAAGGADRGDDQGPVGGPLLDALPVPDAPVERAGGGPRGGETVRRDLPDADRPPACVPRAVR